MPIPKEDWNKWFKYAIDQKLIEFESCWIWYGAAANGVYPQIRNLHKKKVVGVARMIWEQYNDRELEEHEFIKKTCEDPLCINPEHLYVSIRNFKGRKRHSQQIREAIIYLQDLGIAVADIAKALNMSWNTVDRICKKGK